MWELSDVCWRPIWPVGWKLYHDPQHPLHPVSQVLWWNGVGTSSLRARRFFLMRGMNQDFNAVSIPGVPMQKLVFCGKILCFFFFIGVAVASAWRPRRQWKSQFLLLGPISTQISSMCSWAHGGHDEPSNAKFRGDLYFIANTGIWHWNLSLGTARELSSGQGDTCIAHCGVLYQSPWAWVFFGHVVKDIPISLQIKHARRDTWYQSPPNRY